MFLLHSEGYDEIEKNWFQWKCTGKASAAFNSNYVD